MTPAERVAWLRGRDIARRAPRVKAPRLVVCPSCAGVKWWRADVCRACHLASLAPHKERAPKPRAKPKRVRRCDCGQPSARPGGICDACYQLELAAYQRPGLGLEHAAGSPEYLRARRRLHAERGMCSTCAARPREPDYASCAVCLTREKRRLK